MKAIRENPFRIIGVPANSTEKEIQKQLSKTKAFATVGKELNHDYDFNFMGSVSRTEEDIHDASNKIQQTQNKLLYSLFWFVKNTPFDEIALNNLKGDDIEKAIEIWDKTLKEEITTKNFTAYHNISTLYIALSAIYDKIEIDKLQAGVILKGRLIHSDSLKDLAKLITGNGSEIEKDDVYKKFIDEFILLLKPYLNKKNGITTFDLITLFQSYPTKYKKYITSKFTEVPISIIETKIQETLNKRKNNPGNSDKFGNDLYFESKPEIEKLKKIMGDNNLQLQMLINKVGDEIINCSIEFFNHWNRKGNETLDPYTYAMNLVSLTENLETNGSTRDRIFEVKSSLNRTKSSKYYQFFSDVKNLLSEFKRMYNKTKSQVSNPYSSIDGIQTINSDNAFDLVKELFDELSVKELVLTKDQNLYNDFISFIQYCSNFQFKEIRTRSTPGFLLTDDYYSSFESHEALWPFDLVLYKIYGIASNYKKQFIDELPIENPIRISFTIDKLEYELKSNRENLANIHKKEYLKDRLKIAMNQLEEVKKWQLFRSGKRRLEQIAFHKMEIKQIEEEAERLRTEEKNNLKHTIQELENEIYRLNNLKV